MMHGAVTFYGLARTAAPLAFLPGFFVSFKKGSSIFVETRECE